MQSSLCSATSTEAWAIRVIFTMQSLEIVNVACYQAVSLHQPATDRLFALTCACGMAAHIFGVMHPCCRFSHACDAGAWAALL